MNIIWNAAFVFLGLIQVSLAMQWTSQNTLSDQSTIPVCAGQNVDLAWTYSQSPSDHAVDIEWYFRAYGQSTDQLLATMVNGHFFADPSASHHMQHLANAGIRLLNVTVADSGTYSVHVNIQGMTQTFTQSVHLDVTAASITTDGSLHAQLQGAVFMSNTQQHHLILTCGTFSSVWDSRVNVVWTTPTHQTLSSTSHEHGHFSLAVPNPFVSGQYTCRVDNSSPARVCIPSNSPLLAGATVLVDGTEGRLMLLESREEQMASQIQTLLSGKSQMEAQIQNLQYQKSQMATQIQNLRYQNADLSSSLTEMESQVHHLEQNIIETQLVGGYNSGEGRVQVRILRGMVGGSWGTVCDDNWTNNEGKVVCRHLGKASAHVKVWSNAHFGEGSGATLMDGLHCDGTESTLLGCRFNGFGNEDCSHSEDAGVTCFDIRLVGGSNSHEGRVEVRVGSDSFGTVCDDSWDTDDAKVVCRMLGLPSANAKAWTSAHFGSGSGSIMMDEVKCNGWENHLLDCPFNGLGSNDCTHVEDAGVTCA